METLVNKCRRKLRLIQTRCVRSMMDSINWDSRLIAIRGAKGVGKTTLMLQYLKLHHCDCQSSLYVSLDDAYFTQHTLYEFVELFYQHGGKHLFVDEVHKYPYWSVEIKNAYDDFPDLRIVLSGSSLLQILNGDADLSRRCVPYEVSGLSFREYMMMAHGFYLPIITLQQLLSNPYAYCDEVCTLCRPLAYFDEYLRQGYYPFILEGKDEYPLRVENVVQFILNVELPQLCNVDVSSVRKLHSLLVILSDNVPMQVDISKLSALIGVSRQTLIGYLQFLHRARLLNLIYSDEGSVKRLQKPDKIYLENPNLMEVLSLSSVNRGTLCETFLVSQLLHAHRVEYAPLGDFLVDGRYTIEVGGSNKDGKQIANIADAYIASDNIESAYGNKIPLWAFGCLY